MKIKRILAFALVLTGAIGLFSFTSNEDAINFKSKLFAAPCKMKVTNNTGNIHYLSLSSTTNVYAYANSTVNYGCACTGYLQLYTPGPVSWQLIDNDPSSATYLQAIGNGGLSGLFDIDYF